MVLLAAMLTASIHLEIDLGALLRRSNDRQVKEVTCNIHTVGYRFVGRAGQQFRYAGEEWVVPTRGSIELIADPGNATYTIGGRSLPLDVWALDQYGFREVPLPSPDRRKEN